MVYWKKQSQYAQIKMKAVIALCIICIVHTQNVKRTVDINTWIEFYQSKYPNMSDMYIEKEKWAISYEYE